MCCGVSSYVLEVQEQFTSLTRLLPYFTRCQFNQNILMLKYMTPPLPKLFVFLSTSKPFEGIVRRMAASL